MNSSNLWAKMDFGRVAVVGSDPELQVAGELIRPSGTQNRLARRTSWRRLVAVIANELEDILPNIAANGSIVNALLYTTPILVSEATVLTCQIKCTSKISGALRDLFATDIPETLLHRIQSFCARLEYAGNATLAFFNQPKTIKPRRDVHLEVLASIWLATTAEAMPLLETLLESSDPIATSDRWQRCRAFKPVLQEVISGGWPCLGADGRVQLTGLTERRREQRIQVEWTVKLLRGTSEIFAQLNSLSRSGARLTCLTSLSVGDAINMILANERAIEGHIVWSDKEFCGLKFRWPLEPGDTLLSSTLRLP